MKRLTAILLFGTLAFFAADAQIMPQYVEFKDYFEEDAVYAIVRGPSSLHPSTAEINIDNGNGKKPGTALLVAAGCLTAAGIALYASAWGMVSDGSSIGSVFSIAGITCVGISVPLYIAGGLKRKAPAYAGASFSSSGIQD